MQVTYRENCCKFAKGLTEEAVREGDVLPEADTGFI